MQINGAGPIIAENPAPAASASTGISADFDTFLRLLTTQLRSQDPLNPIDSTDFIAQLASFSAVEQQTRTNQLLETLVAGSGPTSGLSSLVSWIGLDVAAEGPVQFDGQSAVSFLARPIAGADAAVMTVYNDFGSPVARVQVDPSASEIGWSGAMATGETAAPGAYRAEIVYSAEGAPLGSRPAQTYARVREIRMEDGGAMLLLGNGVTVAPKDVSVVRDRS